MAKQMHDILIARLAAALLMGSTILLAGCQVEEAVLEDSYAPVSVAERYPIKVKKAPVKMGLAAGSGTLKPDQVNAVMNFANDAKRSAASRVTVRWPSRSSRSQHLAREIAEVMIGQGVPAEMIVATSYSGSAGQPVELSFVRKVAVTRECGDWSENLAYHPANRHYPNFGCALQNNVAAMVANPGDFEIPRAMAAVDAADRYVVMSVYHTNETAGDYWKLSDN